MEHSIHLNGNVRGNGDNRSQVKDPSKEVEGAREESGDSSPSRSRPLLRLTDAMSSMRRGDPATPVAGVRGGIRVAAAPVPRCFTGLPRGAPRAGVELEFRHRELLDMMEVQGKVARDHTSRAVKAKAQSRCCDC